jgi:hypothetical protein
VPDWQVAPPRQSAFVQQLANGMHAELQLLSPCAHAHTPDWQVLPPVQSALVQQFAVGMHAFAQSLRPAWQLHTPLVQTPPDPQSEFTQHPVAVAWHVPEQSDCPAGHAHVPDWQVLPSVQSVLAQQLVVGMQTSPHALVDAAQVQVVLLHEKPPEQPASAQQLSPSVPQVAPPSGMGGASATMASWLPPPSLELESVVESVGVPPSPGGAP